MASKTRDTLVGEAREGCGKEKQDSEILFPPTSLSSLHALK